MTFGARISKDSHKWPKDKYLQGVRTCFIWNWRQHRHLERIRGKTRNAWAWPSSSYGVFMSQLKKGPSCDVFYLILSTPYYLLRIIYSILSTQSHSRHFSSKLRIKQIKILSIKSIFSFKRNRNTYFDDRKVKIISHEWMSTKFNWPH